MKLALALIADYAVLVLFVSAFLNHIRIDKVPRPGDRAR